MSLVKRKDGVLDTVFFTGIMCISSDLHPQITCGKSETETQVDEEAIWGKPGEATGLTCFSCVFPHKMFPHMFFLHVYYLYALQLNCRWLLVVVLLVRSWLEQCLVSVDWFKTFIQ